MSTSERKKQKAVEKLESFAGTYPAEIMHRDGRLEIGHVQRVIESFNRYALLHGSKPLDPESYYGSKLDESDLFTNTPLDELGYVRNPKTGKKISLVPFHY